MNELHIKKLQQRYFASPQTINISSRFAAHSRIIIEEGFCGWFLKIADGSEGDLGRGRVVNTAATADGRALTTAFAYITGLRSVMGLSVPGLVASVLFYAFIVAVGFWGARKRLRGGPRTDRSEDLMLGGRSVSLAVGVFTIIATWVDGGFLSGIVEETAVRGLLWCQAPVGYCVSLFVVGALFSGPMWRAGHVTLLDPLEQAFGSRMTALLFIPALAGELFWCGAILNALGATVSVITGLGYVTCVSVAASVVALYTCVGGLYSIAYTDVLQLLIMTFGLWVILPFALSNDHVKPLGSLSLDQWLGTMAPWQVPSYVDSFLMIVFGGVPWQMDTTRLGTGALRLPINEAAQCDPRTGQQRSPDNLSR
ncbi:high-affinity choline transporter 1 [Ixodes scapularis]